jgi:plasmid maintenance system killer protein
VAHLFEGGAARWGVALRAKTRLLVVGAGGHGRSVAEAAELSGQFHVHALSGRLSGVHSVSINLSYRITLELLVEGQEIVLL